MACNITITLRESSLWKSCTLEDLFHPALKIREMPKESSRQRDLQVHYHRECCHRIKASSSQRCGGFNLKFLYFHIWGTIYITDTSDITTMEVHQAFMDRGLGDVHGLTLEHTEPTLARLLSTCPTAPGATPSWAAPLSCLNCTAIPFREQTRHWVNSTGETQENLSS